MTKNRFNRNCLSTITLAALLLAAPMAYAEKGKRICGQTADMPPGAVLGGKTLPAGGKIGILYEVNDDKLMRKACDGAIDAIRKAVKTPEMSGFVWKEWKRAECEWPGADFVSDANKTTDMCEYMANHETNDKGYKGYVVVKVYNSKQKGAASTSYNKQ